MKLNGDKNHKALGGLVCIMLAMNYKGLSSAVLLPHLDVLVDVTGSYWWPPKTSFLKCNPASRCTSPPHIDACGLDQARVSQAPSKVAFLAAKRTPF